MTRPSSHPATVCDTKHAYAPAHLRKRRGLVAGLLLAGFVVVSLFDRSLHEALAWTLANRHLREHELWYLLLRNLGSLWTWLIVGVGLIACDGIRARKRSNNPALYPRDSQDLRLPKQSYFWFNRGLFIILSAATAGLLAELLKLVIGRERPTRIVHDELVYQGYRFRGFLQGFVDSSNLGLPSSHAATAAGGAFAMCYLWRKKQPIWQLSIWLIALVAVLGCSLTRILAGAHFASDVYAGMVIGWASAWLLKGVVLGSGQPDSQSDAGDLLS